MKPPPLKNDCFALPPGTRWAPVEEALALLRDRLAPVTPVTRRPLAEAAGLFLAEDVTAARSNPPLPNSAVDGYGFAGGRAEGVHVLPLAPGRAAAGAPFAGALPEGQALRVLTGAALPEGVDTVVLEEDVTADPGRVAFRGPVKQGANTRRAGEDVAAGAPLLRAGTRLRPQELALLAATGVHEVAVHAPLRVGVLSTGDEIRAPGQAARDDQIYDANRPMLLALLAGWGCVPVDLGQVPDDRAALRARLDAARGAADVVLTSGGASAGDEDHVSALLRETGTLALWRIAIKPGRPLALGLWDGMPVFGLPGNPVAAFTCTLVFAEPALRRLAGGGWRLPQGVTVPAAFSKRKKPGRREYLRARLNAEGAAEVFVSEGSGRISGLSWATGLVELEDGAREVAPGDPVRFLPFQLFGRD
jgi:molybdopterin molybdotransferase